MTGPGQPGERFPVSRWRGGYSIDEVDAFMNRVDAGTVRAGEIRSVAFSPARLARGYEMAAVDAALDEAAERVRGLADMGLGPTAETAAPPAAAATGPADRASGRPRFRLTRMGPGYAVEEVDAFLARVEAGEVSADEIAAVSFRSTRLHPGYEEQAVDEALDQIETRLRRQAL